MSTRLISSILILEGLVLLALSLGEIRRERQECRELRAAHQLSSDISDQFAKLNEERGQVFRTSPDILEGLYADGGWSEMPWWIVWGVGAALLAVGVIGSAGSWNRASRFHDLNRLAAANRRFCFYLLLIGLATLAVCYRINLERVSSTQGQSTFTANILRLIAKLPALPRTIVLHWYSQTAEGVSAIKVPYNPADGPWMLLENAMVGFADSNGIQIARFEGAGSREAYVCVKSKDASAMRKFVRSMSQGASKGGSANGSQPVRPETNQPSSPAGFRR